MHTTDEQLFQAFNRLGQEAGTVEGTGIGLVVSKRLIELMGGVIGVESVPRVGSVFWFELLSVVEPQLCLDLEQDVILMDINLPGINGFEVLKILLSDPLTARIPIIALSANAMHRDIKKGLDLGFFCYITKPIKVNEFMDALDEALKIMDKQSVGAG